MPSARDPEAGRKPEAKEILRDLGRMLDQADDAVIAFDPDRKIIFWNRGAEKVYGWSAAEAAGRSIQELLNARYSVPADEILRILHAEGHWAGDIPCRRKDGTEVVVASRWTLLRDAKGRPKSVLELDCDITERRRSDEENSQYREGLEELVAERTDRLAAANKRLRKEIAERERAEEQLRDGQERLHHARRMEAVARLAGGIAHDFNNLLTVVSGYCDMLLSRLGEGDANRQAVEQIRRAGDRATALTHQLLALGGRQTLRSRVVDLGAVLGGMAETLRRLAGDEIEVVVSGDSALWTVAVDPGQIEQVVVNLVVNARESMPKGGRIAIETRNVSFDPESAHFHFDIRPGDYVLLSVSDTGVGMDEPARARVFEPFFAVKDGEKDAGLGLAAVYGIVRQSGGHIWALSEPGKGTTFRMHFPRESAAALEQERREAESAGGSETVLLVDDDEPVRELVSEMLRLKGYEVLEAGTGEEALRLVGERREPVHAVVTDVVMAGMSGPELAERIRRVHPGVKVLFISGSTENAAVRKGGLEIGTDFLSKPFSHEELGKKVRRLLRPRGVRGRVA